MDVYKPNSHTAKHHRMIYSDILLSHDDFDCDLRGKVIETPGPGSIEDSSS